MPFNIDLSIKQKTKKWTFKKTDETAELQKLLDKGDRRGYGARLIELSKTSNGGHKFTRTKGVVYELFDEGETIDVPVKFQVKNSVITWAFIAPMDSTHQSFRDLVFNTAAKAHACVENSCETYYRGTNHYHLKVMHSYAEESEFNHNHYRTKNDGPITPVEVYNHLFAFYAQKEGQKFISCPEERNDIILKFAMFWAEFNADIKYVGLSLMKGEGGIKKVIYQLEEIAKLGTLTPEQANRELDTFFASEHGKNMFKLAEQGGIKKGDLGDIKKFLKESYAKIYLKVAPKIDVEIALDPSLEPHRDSSPSNSNSSSRAGSGSRRSSPRDEYISASDQVLDDVDQLEFEAFAADLTKHCQSINKELLEDLELEDFRKGLMLYHALRTVQQDSPLKPKEGQRFHPDVITDLRIKDMIRELPTLQIGSTEDELGGTLLNKLVNWVKTASPELDTWVDWVKVNGSRGLGSEIALVRLSNGTVDLRQAVPQGDRNPDDKLAEIDFDKVDLRAIFLPDPPIKVPTGPKIDDLKKVLGEELRQMTLQQSGPQKLDKEIFQAKVGIIASALGVLSGKVDVAQLKENAESSADWKSVSLPGLKSQLEEYILDVIGTFSPSSSHSLALVI